MSHLPPDHIALVEQARRGDEKAFARLAERSVASLRRQAAALLRDEHAAEDVAQDALVAAWFGLRSLEQPRTFDAWLRQIVRHHAYRRLRGRDVELAPMDRLTSAGHAIEQIERAEEHGAVRDVIAGLPAELREVVRLFYIRQCSQREVAAFLDLPLTTVNNRLHKARRLLKERMLTMTQHAQPSNPDLAVGTVTGVDGPVVTVRFDDEPAANVFDALAVVGDDGRLVEAMKVAQRLDAQTVRCLATGPAEAVTPGVRLINTRRPAVQMQSYAGPVPAMAAADVRRLVGDPAQRAEVLETGIKPIDLFCPWPRRGTAALAAVPGVGRLALLDELSHRLRGQEGLELEVLNLVGRGELDQLRAMLGPPSFGGVAAPEHGFGPDVRQGWSVMWILTDQTPTPEHAKGLANFDAVTCLSPVVGVQQGWPAVDVLASTSRLLEPAVVGERHVRLAREARELLGRAQELMTDPVLLELLACQAVREATKRAQAYLAQRLAELDGEDRQLAMRGRRLQAFLTVPFFTTEVFTGLPGRAVSLAQTLDGVEAILAGEYDDVPERRLRYIGGVDGLSAAG